MLWWGRPIVATKIHQTPQAVFSVLTTTRAAAVTTAPTPFSQPRRIIVAWHHRYWYRCCLVWYCVLTSPWLSAGFVGRSSLGRCRLSRTTTASDITTNLSFQQRVIPLALPNSLRSFFPALSQKRSRRQLSMAKTDENSDEEMTPRTSNSPRRKTTSTKKENTSTTSPKRTPTKRAKKEEDGDKPVPTKKAKPENGNKDRPKPKKAPAHQVLTERDVLPKLWDPAKHPESYTFRIATWNVAGLRALQKKDPEAIANLIQRLKLDVLCLQEHKLQESHLTDPKVAPTLPDVAGYTAHYTCSTAKKGYSGTACFIKNYSSGNDAGGSSSKKKVQQTSLDAFVKPAKGSKPTTKKSTATTTTMTLPVDVKLLEPESVSMQMGVDEHDQEGRIICMDFPLFTAVNLYVPNSGQKLERLNYRTKNWDKDLLKFMQQKQKDRGVPVLWLGDLNVAHTHLEIWNDGAKHLAKQAGVTVEERESFQAQLDAGFIDAFRHLHPTAQGHYTYWSQRAGNRAPNKGLRLDYFVCDPELFDEASPVVVRDSYMVEDQEGSDHCPAVVELEIKKPVA